MKQHDPLDVQPERCKTCPWRVGNQELITKITAKVLNHSNHICHNHDTKVCRGSRDVQIQVFHRLGVLEVPTHQGYKRAIYKSKKK